MYHVQHAFIYVTESGHRQRIGEGKFDWLPAKAVEAARECGALGGQATRAPENKMITQAPVKKRRGRPRKTEA